MTAKTTRPSVPVPEKVEHQLEQYEVVSGLQSAVEEVEQALHGLRDLAKRLEPPPKPRRAGVAIATPPKRSPAPRFSGEPVVALPAAGC